jgi:hypothetical protein
MDHPEKLATLDTQDTRQTKQKQNKTRYNMCWTPLCANKHASILSIGEYAI